jgi:hypothetical protein
MGVATFDAPGMPGGRVRELQGRHRVRARHAVRCRRCGLGCVPPTRGHQVFLDTLMVGNFEEKSLAFCAIFTATLRATDM